MKVAICFSGAIRSFKYCYPSIYKYLIEPLNADIFLHAWSISKIDNTQEVKYKFTKDLCDENYVIEKLCPKKYVIDEYNSTWESKIIKEADMDKVDFMIIPDKYKKICKNDPYAYKKYAYNALGMYYKIMKCNELKGDFEKEHNFEYDIVIRARLDFMWTKFVSIDMLPIKNVIFIMKDDYITSSSIVTNDKFFGGPSKIMNEFTNLFKHIKHLYKQDIPIQGSDLNEYFLTKFNHKLVGNKFYYYKFISYLLKENKKTVYIELSNHLNIILCEKFLKYNYKVYGICNNKTIKSYYNYYPTQSNNKYDYIILDKPNNKIKNYYLLDFNNSYEFNKNYTLIKINSNISNETEKLEFKCNIQDLTNFLFWSIISNNIGNCEINGSTKIIPTINDEVIFDTFLISNKVRKFPFYKIVDIRDKYLYLKLNCEKYSDYEVNNVYNNLTSIKIETNKIIFLEFINLYNKFINTKIPSKFN